MSMTSNTGYGRSDRRLLQPVLKTVFAASGLCMDSEGYSTEESEVALMS